MANRTDNRDPGDHRAIGLWALGGALYCGYLLFEGGDRSQVWNIAGAVVRSALLLALTWPCRGRIRAVVAWWLFEESLVVWCGLGYMIHPWPVPAGMDQCSALVGFDLSKLSAVLMVAVLVWLLRRKSD